MCGGDRHRLDVNVVNDRFDLLVEVAGVAADNSREHDGEAWAGRALSVQSRRLRDLIDVVDADVAVRHEAHGVVDERR